MCEYGFFVRSRNDTLDRACLNICLLFMYAYTRTFYTSMIEIRDDNAYIYIAVEPINIGVSFSNRRLLRLGFG